MRIGPSFPDELIAAGISLDGLSWNTEAGTLIFADSVPDATRQAVLDVLAVHDPLKRAQDAQARRVHPYYFRLRFTQAQRVAIATSTDPAVIDLREGFAAADTIGLDDRRTAGGLQLLADKGLIDQADVAKLLADRKPEEKP